MRETFLPESAIQGNIDMQMPQLIVGPITSILMIDTNIVTKYLGRNKDKNKQKIIKTFTSAIFCLDVRLKCPNNVLIHCLNPPRNQRQRVTLVFFCSSLEP